MELKNQVQAQRDFFASRATLPYEFRRAALENLLKGIKRHEQDILQALWIDLRKSEFEAWGTEVGIVESEIRYAIKNLKKWMRTVKRPTPLMLFPSQSRIVQEPLGVSLIIAPWNYPFQLVLMPLVGAIAAGNCAIVKPSTAAQATAEILEKIINEVFDPNYVKVINGENSLTDELLAERFDYIFYTGGIGYGKYVATAAAKHLTPTTLELGGKSPCIVARDADIALAARRIV
ncbi:MAG: aldehyde dehydrogenase family protein, partial [Mucinivorans sp.]